MYSEIVKIKNKSGLHARPASNFVQKASKYKSNITVKYNDKTINAKSMIGILSAGIGSGSEIEIIAEGIDEKEAVNVLISLVDSNFGE